MGFDFSGWALLFSCSLALGLFALYLLQSRDRSLLARLPLVQALPNSELDLARKELKVFEQQCQRLEPAEQDAQRFRGEILQKRVFKLEEQAEEDLQAYLLACKNQEVAWRDFQALFCEAGFVERSLSPRRRAELDLFRQRLLKAQQVVQREKDRILARERIWLQESQKPPAPQPTGNQGERPPTAPARPPQFGQDDLASLYPDFSQKTYLDESLDWEQAGWEELQGANFQGSRLVGVTWQGQHRYRDCCFRGVDFSQSRLLRQAQPHRFVQCDFSHSQWLGARLEMAAFYDCDFSGAVLAGLRLTKVKFINCNFDQTKFPGVDFSQVVMSTNMLQELDFSPASHPPRNHSLWQESQPEPPQAEEADPPPPQPQAPAAPDQDSQEQRG